MAQNHGALVVVGSGPGIGSHSAAHFARSGFERIILMSRNAARLRVDAVLVQSAAPEAVVDIIPVDLSINSSVRKALIDVDKILDGMPLECVIFNAANSSKSDMMSFAAEDLQRDLHISVVSLFTVAKWAFPQLLELAHNDGYKPSLLVTSGTICQDPYPPLFSLSACKAAQYNMVTSFSKVYGPQGIHCGLIVVGGRLRDDKHIASAPQVAEQVWTLFNQSKENWVLEITLTDALDDNEGDEQYMEADGHSVQPIQGA